jgi:hypothetical protein
VPENRTAIPSRTGFHTILIFIVLPPDKSYRRTAAGTLAPLAHSGPFAHSLAVRRSAFHRLKNQKSSRFQSIWAGL